MEKYELTAIINYIYLKKWTAAQIKAQLEEVHGNSAIALRTIYFWIDKFKHSKSGRISSKDKVKTKEIYG